MSNFANSAREPQREDLDGKPDRILAILNAWGLVGEIEIWQGEFSNLPAEDSPVFQNFASQVARAFERTRSLEMEQISESWSQKTVPN